jgi:hypothetical protein
VSFRVDPDKIVFQKDLKANTAESAQATTSSDRDLTWTEVDVSG